MTNEPTPEEIERVACEFWNCSPKELNILNADYRAALKQAAKWHLTQLAQLTKERDEYKKKLNEIRDYCNADIMYDVQDIRNIRNITNKL